MHFVGPDQLHGFEERLTTDIYPADFGWTPDYTKPGERIDWWYHNLGSVTGAGVAEITNQLEYDDEVAYHAGRKLYDLARGHDGRPWCLTVSFTHPHDPYVARKRFWDLYEDCPALDPVVAPIPFEAQDPHSQRLMLASDHAASHVTEEDVRRSRRAYFANISYIDEKIGELLDILERCRMADDTVIVFVSDHGDMLGERGLWFKMNFLEGSARVPLMIAAPGLPAGRIDRPVSTLDVLPTLADLAALDLSGVMPWTDGESLVPLARGEGTRSAVPMEYAAEGSYAPLVALRDGPWKLSLCELDPPMLTNLDEDPHELANRAQDPACADIMVRMAAAMNARWDLARFDAEVRSSQARRHVVYEALRNGAYYPWDFQPLQKASERYMRNHMDLNILGRLAALSAWGMSARNISARRHLAHTRRRKNRPPPKQPSCKWKTSTACGTICRTSMSASPIRPLRISWHASPTERGHGTPPGPARYASTAAMRRTPFRAGASAPCRRCIPSSRTRTKGTSRRSCGSGTAGRSIRPSSCRCAASAASAPIPSGASCRPNGSRARSTASTTARSARTTRCSSPFR